MVSLGMVNIVKEYPDYLSYIFKMGVIINLIIRFFNLLEELPIVGQVFQKLHNPFARLMYYSPFYKKQRISWEIRINDVIACPDNKHIPRADDAGRIIDGYLVMHNGINIIPGSYYGEGIRLMLERNRGVHEPQEEYAFMEVLKHMPAEATMMELGAYWGFYSLWFQKMVKTPITYLIEPQINNLRNGKLNFVVNNYKGTFIRGNIGAVPDNTNKGAPLLTVDGIADEHGIKHINILHTDIQGFELDMLHGAKNAFDRRMIDYVFISTHSNELHKDCISFLEDRDFLILADADLDETYSCDGIIVARRMDLKTLESIAISKKQ